MNTPIKSYPGPLSWVMGTLTSLYTASFLALPLYFLIMATLWMLGFNFQHPDNQSAVTTVAVTSIVGLIIFFVSLQSIVMLRKGYWQLTDTALIQGRIKPVKILLSDIKEIGAGVPCSVNFAPKLEKIAQRLKRKKKRVNRYEFAAKTTLILRLTNNRLLLFRINEMPNGLNLMRQLLEIKADTVNTEIEYTQAEQAVMKVNHLNRVMKLH